MDARVRREADDLLADIAGIVEEVNREYGNDEGGQFLTLLHFRVGEMLDEAANA